MTAGVISAHNQQRWIATSIESLLPEVDELIVVDDGSADESAAIIKQLADRHQFRFIRNTEARGVSEAYNEAVDSTDADILLIQGGDDQAIPGRGARSEAALSNPDTILVYSLPTVIDAVGRRLPEDSAPEFLPGATMEDPLPYLFNVSNYICAPSTALRRRDYVDHGGFPSNIDALQDYALWLELASWGRFACESTPLVEYRKHTANLSRQVSGVDSQRRRREAAENEWIRNRFLDRASSATLSRIAPTPGTAGSEALSRDEQALLIRLTHSDPLLVRRGLHDLFSLLAAEGDSVLTRLGIPRSSLTSFANQADHLGLASLSRAQAALNAISAEPSP